MLEIYGEITELLGNDRCHELKDFLDERNLVPITIEEIPKCDDRFRYLIRTNSSKVELSDSTFVDVGVYVTYNPIRNKFVFRISK